MDVRFGPGGETGYRTAASALCRYATDACGDAVADGDAVVARDPVPLTREAVKRLVTDVGGPGIDKLIDNGERRRSA